MSPSASKLPRTSKAPKAPDTHAAWHGRLELVSGGATLLGDARIRLLEAIDEQGSISRAAPLVPLSYKGAWDAVEAMNNLSTEPLVERSTGGRHGGGAVLTSHGRRMVELYRAMEGECQLALARLLSRGMAGAESDVGAFAGFLRNMALRTSARNQFLCMVVSLEPTDVDVRLHLSLDGDQPLSVLVTQASVERLGIREGMSLMVLVKASAVGLGRRAPAARADQNTLWGSVSEVIEGAQRSEVTLQIGAHRFITAVLPASDAQRVRPEVGERLCAHFSPSSPLVSL
jgi:molybdate transport system regulatory protein